MGTRAMMSCVAAALLLCCASLPLQAAPYTPAADDVVVQRLPSRLLGDAQRQEERRQRALLRQQPASVPLALRSAREAIDRARELGDPRELGQAQAALAPWWSQPAPPAPVRLMRAIILQSQHDFAGSLKDLDALLAGGPELPLGVRAQAELTRATVLQVTGRWAEADAGCERLLQPPYAPLGDAVRLPAQVCRAELASLQGREQEADRLLAPWLRAAGPGDAWMTLVRAERADRRGLPEAGELYRRALSLHTDVYTLAAYADWLLARQKAPEVARLLAGREEADALLLRLAIAWQRMGDPRAPGAIATLAERFAASLARGDRGHEREQALFALHLSQDGARALDLARQNWQRQKEPVDALLLVAAAQAAGQPAAAAPVREFAQATGWVDRRLAALDPPVGGARAVQAAWRKP